MGNGTLTGAGERVNQRVDYLRIDELLDQLGTKMRVAGRLKYLRSRSSYNYERDSLGERTLTEKEQVIDNLLDQLEGRLGGERKEGILKDLVFGRYHSLCEYLSKGNLIEARKQAVVLDDAQVLEFLNPEQRKVVDSLLERDDVVGEMLNEERGKERAHLGYKIRDGFYLFTKGLRNITQRIMF